MKISIIIPTLNEEKNIGELLGQLSKIHDDRLLEIIVVDAGSKDSTQVEVKKHAAVKLLVAPQGRAQQMNVGSTNAIGDVYYFIHADSRPPISFVDDIQEALENGYEIGSYRFKFNSNNLQLRINSFCTRFNILMMRGGDQTLFITKAFFQKLNGFDEDYVIMEDFDLIRRARRLMKFKIFEKSVLVSARKYEQNSYLRVQIVNLCAFLLFYLGASPRKIQKIYHNYLKLN